jgi:hypothetical protein
MTTCDRCKKESNILTGSYFNTEMICLSCDEKEKNHDKYKDAKDAELEQVKQGNYNFEGIGLPNDLK